MHIDWQQYHHEGWGECSLVEMTAMENYSNTQLFFFLTYQPPATKQAQNLHFFSKFSTQEGIFAICLQTN